jgi:hypothetical protein
VSRTPTEESGDPVGAIVRAVLARPSLWRTALGAWWRLTPRGWWRAGSRLPVPDRALWRFRMVTAYGDPDARPRTEDVISYLEWCRSTDQLVRRGSHLREGPPASRPLGRRHSG